MMGKTHALGGAAALALVALATGHTHAYPIWTFGIAAVSALVPDADNHGQTLMARPWLRPLAFVTAPLWYSNPAHHRGRSHSIVAMVAYGAMVWAFVTAVLTLLSLGTHPAQLTVWPIVVAATAGYGSHLVLDLPNIPGMWLLWPLRINIMFPPWRAHGCIPGRFNAGSRWEYLAAWLPMLAFTAWFLATNFPGTLAATVNDPTLRELVAGALGVVGKVLGEIVHAVRVAAHPG